MVVVRRSLLVIAVLLVASWAHATTLLSLDLSALIRGSSHVVRAVARTSNARWTKDGGRIMTDTVFEVRETWKGAPVTEVTVMQPGGEVGDVGQLVHGTVKFRPGEEVVLFLEPRGDRFLLTGMVQGRFKVERSSDGKAIFARQELEGEALFLDAVTHQPVQSSGLTLTIDALRAQVVGLDAVPAPKPVGPVKVTP